MILGHVTQPREYSRCTARRCALHSTPPAPYVPRSTRSTYVHTGFEAGML